MRANDVFGELPSGWEAKRADAVLAYTKETISTAELGTQEVFHYSIPAVQETGDGFVQHGSEIGSDKTRIAGGELLVSKLNPRKGCIILTKKQTRPIVCSTEFVPLTARPEFDIRFAYYVYLSAPIRELISSRVQSATRSHQRAHPSDITKLRIPVPPLPLQHAIAGYLDRETARLDALRSAKERMQRLLAEKRRALISRAVTRGINPEVCLRDSGVPWIGEIPAHWTVTLLKFVSMVRGGLTLGKSYDALTTSPFPYLRVANVQDGHIDLSDVAVVHIPKREAQMYLLRPGDVLMNEGGDADKLGRGSIWRGEIAPCLHQNHVFAVRPRSVSSEWLDLWTSSDGAKSYFETRARQSTNLASISSTNIKELPIVLPPGEEQKQIVMHLQEQFEVLDALASANERSIRLIEERRAALIAAAVTGQLTVSEVPDAVVWDEEMACSSTA